MVIKKKKKRCGEQETENFFQEHSAETGPMLKKKIASSVPVQSLQICKYILFCFIFFTARLEQTSLKLQDYQTTLQPKSVQLHYLSNVLTFISIMDLY